MGSERGMQQRAPACDGAARPRAPAQSAACPQLYTSSRGTDADGSGGGGVVGVRESEKGGKQESDEARAQEGASRSTKK
ncbi:hypothetical protein GCM10010106_51100 [Thermopolyspora flexuosa]|nr:hypothetical protein GCM10010106_51100 [Thermopolyspora flexuosa]